MLEQERRSGSRAPSASARCRRPTRSRSGRTRAERSARRASTGICAATQPYLALRPGRLPRPGLRRTATCTTATARTGVDEMAGVKQHRCASASTSSSGWTGGRGSPTTAGLCSRPRERSCPTPRWRASCTTSRSSPRASASRPARFTRRSMSPRGEWGCDNGRRAGGVARPLPGAVGWSRSRATATCLHDPRSSPTGSPSWLPRRRHGRRRPVSDLERGSAGDSRAVSRGVAMGIAAGAAARAGGSTAICRARRSRTWADALDTSRRLSVTRSRRSTTCSRSSPSARTRSRSARTSRPVVRRAEGAVEAFEQELGIRGRRDDRGRQRARCARSSASAAAATRPSSPSRSPLPPPRRARGRWGNHRRELDG